VRRVGHEAQVIVLDHRGVGFFDLAPQETVEISWKAGKTPDSMACSIPERIRQSFNWMGEIRLGAHGVSFMLPIPQQKEVELNWEMSAVVVEGRWSREVRVAHLFVLAGQAMGVTSREGLSPENQFQNYRVFETVEQNYGLPESFDRRAQETRNLMNCQGFFP
jgi:hypothetical protein